MTCANLPLRDLNTIWFQVTGLLCNLRCTHCLVDSSPDNKSMDFLEIEQVERYLSEAEELGVREVYFTGGEPFLHRDLPVMLERSLEVAPTSVLTNGTLITERLATRLGELAAGARYSLEIRVSIDHPDPARNDRVRGEGSFDKAVRALKRLEENNLLPIVTATEYLYEPKPCSGTGMYQQFRTRLLDLGVKRPRLKILPVFRTGKLDDPASGGAITPAMMEGFDTSLLQCSSTRAITSRGMYACPILVGKPEAKVGNGTLRSAHAPIQLSHYACRTCYHTGMTCSNN